MLGFFKNKSKGKVICSALSIHDAANVLYRHMDQAFSFPPLNILSFTIFCGRKYYTKKSSLYAKKSGQ